MDALAQVAGWPVGNAAVAVVGPGGTVAAAGPQDRVFPWASVTKLLTAVAVLVAAEEGTVDLDQPAGPPGATVRHLLAHASGLSLAGHEPISRPERRRIYSNTGFTLVASTLSHAAGMAFADYLREAVLRPLGLAAELAGSPASGMRGTLADLAAFGRELLVPTLLSGETLDEATAVAFPGLPGVLPGFGRFEPNDWGLGFELRNGKRPHWTGTRNSERTFGHFGRTGTFIWVDPEHEAAVACLTDREFGGWAKDAWPRLSDAVLNALRG